MTSRLRIRAGSGVLAVTAAVQPGTVGALSPTYVTRWGSFGAGSGQFWGPDGVVTDVAGNVYVADGANHRIEKFGPGPTLARPTTWGRL